MAARGASVHIELQLSGTLTANIVPTRRSRFENDFQFFVARGAVASACESDGVARILRS
jgi:hypothetical protein